MNSQLLNKKISDKGLKKQYIAERMGIAPASLKNKMDGITQFKNSEINTIAAILELNLQEVYDIFLS